MRAGQITGIKDLIPESGSLGPLVNRDLRSIGTVFRMEKPGVQIHNIELLGS